MAPTLVLTNVMVSFIHAHMQVAQFHSDSQRSHMCLQFDKKKCQSFLYHYPKHVPMLTQYYYSSGMHVLKNCIIYYNFKLQLGLMIGYTKWWFILTHSTAITATFSSWNLGCTSISQYYVWNSTILLHTV